MKQASNLRPVEAEPILVKTLVQSEQVKIKVEECAQELSVVNTVLKDELGESSGSKDVQDVLIQTEQIEDKVQECVVDLGSVNIALAQEIAERKKLEQKLMDSQVQEERNRYLAYHDLTTGLANRALFYERLNHALVQAERHAWSLAIMYIDLDKFKSINDTYGHAMGDQVLQMVGERLQACVRKEDTISRIGGDEFLCLMLEVKEDEGMAKLAELIFGEISAASEFGSVTINIKPSIGIALYPRDGTNAEALLKNADAAMYKAKQSDKNHAFYSLTEMA